MIKAKALRVCAKGWVRGGIQNNLKSNLVTKQVKQLTYRSYITP